MGRHLGGLCVCLLAEAVAGGFLLARQGQVLGQTGPPLLPGFELEGQGGPGMWSGRGVGGVRDQEQKLAAQL